MAKPRVTCHPLTPERWPDLVRLFGARGACGGCWCMFDRVPRATWEAQKGDGNRAAFRKRVTKGPPPGVLAYVEDVPVGWCAVAPREELVRLARSRVLKPVDERPAWSITCFFIERAHRGQGLSRQLIAAAVDLAREHGATLVEAYPVDSAGGRMPDAFTWTGVPSPFLALGFREQLRRSPKRPILRRELR